MLCTVVFFAVALLLGVGFGIMFPAYNTLFVNLAPNSQRGTATSTYLTSWDVGIGIGMLTGGYIAEVSTFDKAYLFGACLTIVSIGIRYATDIFVYHFRCTGSKNFRGREIAIQSKTPGGYGTNVGERLQQ